MELSRLIWVDLLHSNFLFQSCAKTPVCLNKMSYHNTKYWPHFLYFSSWCRSQWQKVWRPVGPAWQGVADINWKAGINWEAGRAKWQPQVDIVVAVVDTGIDHTHPDLKVEKERADNYWLKTLIKNACMTNFYFKGRHVGESRRDSRKWNRRWR